MRHRYAAAGHWNQPFDENALQDWAESLRAELGDAKPSLGLVFLPPHLFSHSAAVLEILQVHGQAPLLAGCSSTGLIAGNREIEENPGIAAALFSLPEGELQARRFTQEQVEGYDGPGYWPAQTGIAADQTNGWLVFANPFQLDADRWLKQWNESYAPRPIVGGLASGRFEEQRTQVYWNGQTLEDSGLAISFGGNVALGSVISQGCTPIGDTWTITRAEQNLIYEIGNRPAYEVFLDTVAQLTNEEQKRAQGNLFVGLVIDEYQEEFHQGDFLIRNLLGVDPQSGALAVGAFPRTGQTVQFQRRDADAATQDLEALLNRARKRFDPSDLYGGCLCCCNGRGRHLFGEADHDASRVQDHLGPLPLAGFFCNGEIGPVGENSFLHGYTASLALFMKKSAS